MPKKFVQPKENILKVAHQLLETQGYEALSIRSLAAKSGVSIGTIYNYFEDKGVLDHHLMASFWQEFEIAVLAICKDPNPRIYEKLDLINTEMTKFMGLFKTLFSQALESRNYQYAPKDQAVKDAMVNRMATALAQALLTHNPGLKTQDPNDMEIANWILNSMMMTSHMRTMTYEALVPFIKKIIEP